MSPKLYKSLKDAMGNCSDVTSLKISIGSSTSLPQELLSLPNLLELYLSSEGEDLTMEHLPNLKKLVLTGNCLKKISSNIFSMPTLQFLEIKHTSLQELPEIESPNLCLTTLHLQNNKLKCLPESIHRLPGLTTISISANELTTLPNNFDQLTKLARLILDNNKFEKLPDCLLNLKNLCHLSIDDNPFSSTEKEKITAQFNIWF